MESESIATNARPGPSPGGAGARFGLGDGLLLTCWGVVYLACAGLRAIKKPLWYDELFSLDLAALPSVSDTLNSLARGAELNPPLHYLAAKASFALLGTGAPGLRLPSIVGYLVMSLCLYRLAAWRLPKAYAWAAMSFPLVTQAYGYAFEGRPYAMVLGFSGLSLVAWQVATEAEGTRRRVALGLMTLALAAAVSTHYYAVLIFVPIGLGELARSWSRRKIDFPLWVALVAGLFPLIPLRRLIEAASAYKGTFWARPTWSFAFQFYLFLFKGTTIPLVILLIFFAIDTRRRVQATAPGPEASGRKAPVPLHELVAALGFVILPFVGLMLAKLAAGGAFTERYALPAILGFALLVAYTAERVGQGRRLPGAVMTLAFLGWFLSYEVYHLRREPEPQAMVSASEFSDVAATDVPLVFSWSIMFLQAEHDLPPDLAKRTYFLTHGQSTDEIALEKLSHWVPLNIVELSRFEAEHRRFFLCGFPTDGTFSALLRGPYRMTLRNAFRFREGEVVLMLVERDEPPSRDSPTPPGG